MKKLILIILFCFSTTTISLAQIYSTTSGGRWSQTATWIGGVVPNDTTVDVIVQGPVNNRLGNYKMKSLTVTSSGSLDCDQISSGYTNYIHGSMINNGSVQNLNFRIYGDMTNSGTLRSNSIVFMGSGSHELTNSDSNSLGNDYLAPWGTILLNSNLYVYAGGSNYGPDLGAKEIIMQNDFNIYLSSGTILAQNENDSVKVIGNGNTIYGGVDDNAGALRYCDLYDVNLDGTIAVIKRLRFYDNVVNKDTLMSFADFDYERIIHVYKPFKNEGFITRYYNSGGYVSKKIIFNIYSDLINDGTFDYGEVYFLGTEDQKLIMPNDSLLRCKVVLDAVTEGSTYQWQKDGIDIAYKKSKTLTFSTFTAEDQGVYQCIIDGNIKSREITLGKGGGSEPEQIVIMEQNFDSPENLTDWIVVNNHETHTWGIGNIDEHNFNTIDPTSINSAMCPYINEDQDEYLITPKFSLGEGNASVEFYSGYNSQWLVKAKLILMLVTNEGQDWNQIWEFDAATDGWEWKNFNVDLTPYSNQSDIQLAFEYIGNDGDYAALDNMVIKGYEYITDVNDENNSSIPNAFSLRQNYPNPFNPETVISYQLPVNSLVELKVFDMLGREVTALVNEEQAAGTYTVQFDASNLASGIYFYNISAGKFNQTRKMLLVK